LLLAIKFPSDGVGVLGGGAIGASAGAGRRFLFGVIGIAGTANTAPSSCCGFVFSFFAFFDFDFLVEDSCCGATVAESLRF